MDDAFKDGCGDDRGGDSCPICRGEELSADFIAMLKQAAAQPGQVMTIDEIKAWLDSL